MKRVAIYLRVSTNGQNTNLQREEIMSFLTVRGWTDWTIYDDIASGTNGNRAALKQLMSDAKSGKLDLLICWKLDRLFRSLKDLVSVLHELEMLWIEFISLKDGLDLTTSSGRLLTHLIGSFGEFEASLIRERVNAGLANAKTKRSETW